MSLFVRINCRGEWVEKKNRFIRHWEDSKKRGADSVGMYVKKNILYDEFFNLDVQKSGYNCK